MVVFLKIVFYLENKYQKIYKEYIGYINYKKRYHESYKINHIKRNSKRKEYNNTKIY